MSYSFESPKVFDKLLLPEDAPERQAIEISNPLGEDYSIMRTISLNGMLTSLATNFNRRNKDVRLYELGNIYLPKTLPLTELPEEIMHQVFPLNLTWLLCQVWQDISPRHSPRQTSNQVRFRQYQKLLPLSHSNAFPCRLPSLLFFPVKLL